MGFETGSRNNEISRQLVPVFAAELRFPSDSLPPIQEKGSLIDTQQRRAHVNRPEAEPEVLEAPDF